MSLVICRLSFQWSVMWTCWYVQGWGGGGTPILKSGRELLRDWPPFFLAFLIPLGLFLCPTRSYWPPSFYRKKIGLFLPHLIPEIIWPKIGLLFLPKSVIWPFLCILYQVFPWFLIVDLLFFFFIVLRSFLPSFFQNLIRSDWVHFPSYSGPPYQTFCGVPPSPFRIGCKLEFTDL